MDDPALLSTWQKESDREGNSKRKIKLIQDKIITYQKFAKQEGAYCDWGKKKNILAINDTDTKSKTEKERNKRG